MTTEINLHDYDLVIINSSAGKDSVCCIYDICEKAFWQNYSRDKIVVSHQDLGRVEWPGTKELAEKQANHFGLKIYYSKRRNKKGEEETFLEYVLRRGKWPSNKQRWCTSDYKRTPGARVVTMLTKQFRECKVLYVFGFRKSESPSRRKKVAFKVHKALTTKKRLVHEYLAIHEWDTQRVWKTIKENNLPYHYAYDLSMPRLSCVFCIFSPFDALVIAGYSNCALLDRYIEVQDTIGHLFRHNFDLKTVRKAIEEGYKPKNVPDWTM